MKIHVVGANDAFSGYNTSLLYQTDVGLGVLLDCGFTVFPELQRNKLIPLIDIVLISHLHGDHTGSLSTLVLYSKYKLGKQLIIGGVDCTNLLRIMGISNTSWRPLKQSDGVKLETFETPHVPNEELNTSMLVDGKLFYSGDTNNSLLNTDFAKRAEVIFHETTFIKNPTHTNIDELNNAPYNIKNKTWLMHVPQRELRAVRIFAQNNGFAGVCVRGQTIQR